MRIKIVNKHQQIMKAKNIKQHKRNLLFLRDTLLRTLKKEFLIFTILDPASRDALIDEELPVID